MNVYEIVTEKIVKSLEAGVIPWKKPWAGAEMMPRNGKSGKTYRGVNLFLLSLTSQYDNPHWLTYKQAEEMGGNVRKGEKGTPVIFWTKWETEDRITGDEVEIPVLRYYTVFNAEQCEGIDLPYAKPQQHEFAAIESCEAILAGMPANRPTLSHGGNSAHYRPSTDEVNMPTKESFDSTQAYYSTLFHELTHATGHKSRLNRKGITEGAQFGSDLYGREELVAEMGAAFLCGFAGIEPATVDNSASYIASWLKIIRAESKLVVIAAAQAQKACDWIMCKTWEKVEA